MTNTKIQDSFAGYKFDDVIKQDEKEKAEEKKRLEDIARAEERKRKENSQNFATSETKSVSTLGMITFGNDETAKQVYIGIQNILESHTAQSAGFIFESYNKNSKEVNRAGFTTESQLLYALLHYSMGYKDQAKKIVADVERTIGFIERPMSGGLEKLSLIKNDTSQQESRVFTAPNMLLATMYKLLGEEVLAKKTFLTLTGMLGLVTTRDGQKPASIILKNDAGNSVLIPEEYGTITSSIFYTLAEIIIEGTASEDSKKLLSTIFEREYNADIFFSLAIANMAIGEQERAKDLGEIGEQKVTIDDLGNKGKIVISSEVQFYSSTTNTLYALWKLAKAGATP